MNIIIIPVSYFIPSFKNSASERFRCDFLLSNPVFTKYDGSQDLNNYDCIIFQKCFGEECLKISESYRHKIQIYDSTDPDWLFELDRPCLNKLLKHVQFITCSTENLAREFSRFYNKTAYCIPDRYDFNYFKVKKIHEYKKHPVLVWFGYSDNFNRVEPLIPMIKGLDFITICEKSINYGRFIKWDKDTVNNTIIEGDIVLNLPDEYGFKSNNKTTTGWALNLPVVEKVSQLFKFLDYDNRVKEVSYRFNYVRQYYDISLSINSILNIINEV